MRELGTFPFGMPIRRVEQQDRTPKKVFVLGVYASAVHARWIGPDGKQLISAVGVAPEPKIFWNGEGAGKIVRSIEVPNRAGRLVPAPGNLNGPSGRALDDYFLKPLGFTRKSVWLCDLVPHSCMNERQAKRLEITYRKNAKKLGLPDFQWGAVPRVLADEHRRCQIAAEIEQASPEVLITLGDQPLKWFSKFHGSKSRLSSYGKSEETYGQLHSIEVGGNRIGLLPLVHPRQAARLGGHSVRWSELHEFWVRNTASKLL